MSAIRVPPISLRQLEYLVAVADLGGFRRAADACHVSQPALSAQVALAEQLLGVVVFERDRHHVRLSHAGEALVRQARQVLLAAAELQEVAQHFKDPFSATLRVGVIPTVGPYLLPEIGPALARTYPKLGVVWSEERTAVLVRQLAEGALDAAILAVEAPIGECDYAVIGRDPFVVAAAPAHPLVKSRAPMAPQELDGASVLLLDDGHCFRDQALDVCSGAGAKQMSFRATSLPTLVQMVGAGNGVTLLPALAVPVENRRKQLRVRPFAAPIPGRTLALAWRKGSALGPSLARIAETLRTELEEHGVLERQPARRRPFGERLAATSVGERAVRMRASLRHPSGSGNAPGPEKRAQ